MTEAKPQMGPGGSTESVVSVEGSMPTQTPPAGVVGLLTEGPPAPAIAAGMGDAAPSAPASAQAVAAVGAWQNNKKITALWSINQNRNSWAGIEGVGWKRLVNNSDSAIVALTMLASHAREKGSIVNYREESDGMIYEMYVF
ncbi:MAG: hypothetical protein MUC41_01580 [Syntrophobacteraceae bacterium]|nr:hypothetical protein [Syntrophobacteraceae bacterium]